MTDEESKDKNQVDEDQRLALLSKVIKSGSVETFDWSYTDRVQKKAGRNSSDELVTTKIINLQAILINPKWADHGFDTFAATTASANSQTSDTDASSMKPKRQPGKPKVQAASRDDFKESRSAYSGLRIEELKKLVIPYDVMKEGMLFIWAEKELIGEILEHFQG